MGNQRYCDVDIFLKERLHFLIWGFFLLLLFFIIGPNAEALTEFLHRQIKLTRS